VWCGPACGHDRAGRPLAGWLAGCGGWISAALTPPAPLVPARPTQELSLAAAAGSEDARAHGLIDARVREALAEMALPCEAAEWRLVRGALDSCDGVGGLAAGPTLFMQHDRAVRCRRRRCCCRGPALSHRGD
jgi:hypothetical protein